MFYSTNKTTQGYALKKKQKPSQSVNKLPKPSGTKVSGDVYTNYVQFNIPSSISQSVVEALFQALLSDYYRQFCGGNEGGNE